MEYKNKNIYLGIPYTGMEESAFEIVNSVAAILMGKEEAIVYSPISHSHLIAKCGDLPKTWEYWKQVDEQFIKWCDTVVMVVIGDKGMDLIKKSKGCMSEMEIAKKLGKPVEFYKFIL